MDQMNELMEAWKAVFEANPQNANRPFNLDGIISQAHWDAAPRKVLFILKEANGGKSHDIREALQRAAKRKTGWRKGHVLRRVGRWAYGLNGYDGEVPEFVAAKKAQYQTPLSIAYINLRKTAGGARTNPVELKQDVRTYADFIRQQIDLINPEIVVLCGTYRVIKDELYPDLEKVAHRIHQLAGRTFINVHHPAQRKLKARALYEQALESYHQYAKGLVDGA